MSFRSHVHSFDDCSTHTFEYFLFNSNHVYWEKKRRECSPLHFSSYSFTFFPSNHIMIEFAKEIYRRESNGVIYLQKISRESLRFENEQFVQIWAEVMANVCVMHVLVSQLATESSVLNWTWKFYSTPSATFSNPLTFARLRICSDLLPLMLCDSLTYFDIF